MVRRAHLVTLVAAVFLALTLAAGPAAAATPRADLAITHVSGPTSARVGHQVTFHISAVNHGPAASQVDIMANISAGLEYTSVQCIPDVSPDGNYCEFGFFRPGRTVYKMVVVATVLPGAARTQTMTACTLNEASTVDPKPSNDCATVNVTITR